MPDRHTGAVTRVHESPSSSAISAGRRNLIVNGNFDVWQRPSTTRTLSTSWDRATDRWSFYASGPGQVDVSKDTTVPDSFSGQSLKLVVNTVDASVAGTDRYFLQHVIEGPECQPLGFGTSSAKQVTLSFWARTSLAGSNTFCVSFSNDGKTRTYIKEYTISLGDTWQQFLMTIPGDTTGTWTTGEGTAGLRLRWAFGTGDTEEDTADQWAADSGTYHFATSNQVDWIGTLSANFFLSRVQLEVGSSATDFDYRSFAETRQLCERFYQQSYPDGFTAGGTPTDKYQSEIFLLSTAPSASTFSMGIGVRLNPSMAVAPTITYYSPTLGTSAKLEINTVDTDASTSGLVAISRNGFWISASGASSSDRQLEFHYTADCEITS